MRQDGISGSSTSWRRKSYALAAEGKHTFKCRCVKDGSISEGDPLQQTGNITSDSAHMPTISVAVQGRRGGWV